jgi:RNA polymerase sigma factor (sigma-70 family)
MVAVLDDDPAVLRGLVRLLGGQGFSVKPFSSPRALLEEITSLAPDCLIADLAMPDLTGLDVQRVLAESGLECPIIFVTGHGDVRTSVRAMLEGAVDFLTKPFRSDELLDAVERAVSRSRREREHNDQRAAVRDRLASLTHRERQVFERVVEGRLNKQIAADLGISEKTVKVHRGRVMHKMGVRSLAQLVRLSQQVGTSD